MVFTKKGKIMEVMPLTSKMQHGYLEDVDSSKKFEFMAPPDRYKTGDIVTYNLSPPKTHEQQRYPGLGFVSLE